VKVTLLVNASASSVTARTRVVIQKALSADHEVVVAETSRRGHATRLAQGASATGTDVVVVLGGDGTLNEAANGLAGTDCALAALPGGSTNVFARTLGLPDDLIEATSVLLEAMAAGSIRRVGLGAVEGRFFLFHVGIGFDAAVVAQVERRSTLKRYASHPLFIWSGLTTWFGHYDRSSPHLALRYPDGLTVDDGYMAIVQNTDPYTYLAGRPLSLAPEATLDRGLAVICVRTMAPVPMVRLVTGLLTSPAAVRKHPKVHHRVDVAALDVVGLGPVPYQVDGDYLGDTEHLHFEHHPEVLSLVIP